MNAPVRHATLYRMVMDKHVCPFGLKAKHLLESQSFIVDDHWLTTREETDAFKTEHNVKTTPLAFIGGERIGGYDDLRRYFGKSVPDPKAVTYKPVIAVFSVTALMALAASYLKGGVAHDKRGPSFAGPEAISTAKQIGRTGPGTLRPADLSQAIVCSPRLEQSRRVLIALAGTSLAG